jgi:hypothetical protein
MNILNYRLYIERKVFNFTCRYLSRVSSSSGLPKCPSPFDFDNFMAKPTCESVYRISIGSIISSLPKNSLNQNSFLQLIRQGVTHDIELITTPCFFGRHRYWFRCPGCQKRVGVLYKGSKNFSCRTCNHLVYQSQQRTHTGFFGIFDRYLCGDWEIMEEKLRVKYWHGKPTRRYQHLLNQMNRGLTAENLNLFQKVLDKHTERKIQIQK